MIISSSAVAKTCASSYTSLRLWQGASGSLTQQLLVSCEPPTTSSLQMLARSQKINIKSFCMGSRRFHQNHQITWLSRALARTHPLCMCARIRREHSSRFATAGKMGCSIGIPGISSQGLLGLLGCFLSTNMTCATT